jgi:Zn-dependent peptidase ImmA (M78 family)
MPTNRKSIMEAVHRARAEQRAETLIASLNITDPAEIDVEDIAMTQGALVLEGGLTGAEARLTNSPKVSFIRVNSNIRELGRRRFAIGHEVGHLLLHKEPSPFTICERGSVVLFHSSDQKEIEANSFAAALLMPGRMFEALCRSISPSLDLVNQLAAKFQVTTTAACTRYIEFCPHRCCMVISTKGKIRYHRRTADFGYFLQPSENVRPTSYAADLFAGESIRSGMRSVPAGAWLEGPSIDSSKRILEHSVSMPSYESVLTLLWIDNDIDRKVTGEDEGDAEEDASNSRWSWNRYRREEG